jgi:hypothetical protein
MREHFIVSSIRSQEVARTQRSGVRRCEDMLKALDLGNSLLGIHSVSISNIRVAMVKPSGICAFPQWPVGAIPPVRIGATAVVSRLLGRSVQAMRSVIRLSPGRFCLRGLNSTFERFLLFNVEINLRCGAVFDDLLAVQFHL